MCRPLSVQISHGFCFGWFLPFFGNLRLVIGHMLGLSMSLMQNLDNGLPLRSRKADTSPMNQTRKFEGQKFGIDICRLR